MPYILERARTHINKRDTGWERLSGMRVCDIARLCAVLLKYLSAVNKRTRKMTKRCDPYSQGLAKKRIQNDEIRA